MRKLKDQVLLHICVSFCCDLFSSLFELHHQQIHVGLVTINLLLDLFFEFLEIFGNLFSYLDLIFFRKLVVRGLFCGIALSSSCCQFSDNTS
jgi:hypothetical protein